MRTIIRFDKEPHFFELTDEEFAEWERRNAKQIETRRVMASHDEAQALKNAERRGEERGEERANTKWQGVVADKDAEIARLRAQLGKN